MLELPDRYSGAGPFAGPVDPGRPGFPGRGRDFSSFCHTNCGSNRVFTLLSRLHVSPGGRILLQDFLAALSRVCHPHETRSVIAALAGEIEAAGWKPVRGPESGRGFRSGGFDLSVRGAPLAPGIEAVHVLLGYGSTQPYLARYLGQLFPAFGGRIVPPADRRDPPGTPGEPRQAPRVLRTADLAGWLRKEPCIVLTGAGISRASGIPPFHGPGSLEACFEVSEPFPGSAFDWAVRRPAGLASLVGSFQAALLIARPNPAHLALADLERRGVVQQVVTTNCDALHQAAGSVRVKELTSREGWADGYSGKALLVAGVSRDSFGVVAAARAEGMSVAVLNPAVPQFVRETDLYLPGLAEVELPKLAEMLGPS